MNIIELFYKENSKEPAVHPALLNLSEVSAIIRIGQNTVGVVVPGGWYEYSLASDRLNGIELLNRSADKFIEMTSAWRKLHEVEPPKKIGRPAKAAADPTPITSATPRKTLTALADELLKNGVEAPQARVGAPLLTPVPASPPSPLAPVARPPVMEMPPRMAGSTHPFRDSSGLPTVIDLRDISTISGFGDGSNKVRMGLHRGGVRTVFIILKEGERFDDVYTSLYEKWYEINYPS
jgi:hypothetical protein